MNNRVSYNEGNLNSWEMLAPEERLCCLELVRFQTRVIRRIVIRKEIDVRLE
jgi:hypothetical protein